MDVYERVQALERNHTKTESRLAAIEQDEKSVHRRLSKLEDLVESIHTLSEAICEMTAELKNMREDINRLSTRVEALESVPKNRYLSLWKAIITALTGGIVGYILRKVGF